VYDVNLRPFVAEIFSHQTSMAFLGHCFAAQQTAPIKITLDDRLIHISFGQ
jgi:hypothetical protein